VEDLPLYRKVVRSAFLSRRKTLVNNLMQAFGVGRTVAEEMVTGAGIDLKARGETLSVESFARLTEVVKNTVK